MHKSLRLKKKHEFNQVFKQGKVSANHQFVIYYRSRAETIKFRIGISASRKIGNAVARNKIRRRVKEIVRLMENQLVDNMDIVCIVRKPALELNHIGLKRSIIHVLSRARLIRR